MNGPAKPAVSAPSREDPSPPARIPIRYLMLAVLTLISVVPLYFYSSKVVGTNRELLKANERLLENTITHSLAEDIAQRQTNLRAILNNLASAIQVVSGGNLSTDHVEAPELRAMLEQFVTASDGLAYATLLNSEGRGVTAGRMAADVFLGRELERAFAAAREGREYNGQALSIGGRRKATPVMLVSAPLMTGDRFIGMIAVVVELEYLTRRLQEASQRGLVAYVVDRRGRLVAGATSDYAIGQDMTELEIVKNWVEQGSYGKLAATNQFTIYDGKKRVPMLGSLSTVPSLGWAAVAQKRQKDAYQDIYDMQHSAKLLALLAVLVSLGVSLFAAKSITGPLRTLIESSRAIARGDFSKRVDLKSRTEIGELAETFNHMTDDLERLVIDLKRAAEENRTLFLSSIQMLAGAVDEKDPYTRGHSDRVTRYSVIIARELGFSNEEVETVRISAQLHDVGKIGIEDRILKKPGALTPEEFEIMKTHTTKGANILRPVEQLREMLPGIELHHESLDGRGYPHGLRGDQIPLLARIIAVADTFDAMTTNRPYQEAMDPDYVIRSITSRAHTKFDPQVVAALTSAHRKGELMVRKVATTSPEAAVVPAPGTEIPVPAL
ncbi:MAG TPA: HD domain-containing phosphohydrolase [Terriglobales bacterium]|nr:HD domain-containing phosphohydrolase [Terriglobales bacterium]